MVVELRLQAAVQAEAADFLAMGLHLMEGLFHQGKHLLMVA